jgi:hypothetical protein
MAIELGDIKVQRQAYTQRAIIKKAKGNLLEAEEDFAQGARLGNPVAKHEVKSNPYAQSCNEMLQDVMSKLIN